MSGIGVVGNLIVDRYKVVETYPPAGSLTTIVGMGSAAGGLAYSCSVDLARLDPTLRVPVIGVVGSDPDGDLLVTALEKYRGIETAGIRREGQTSFTDVMEDQSGKTRTFFQYRGANALLDVNDVDFDSLDIDLLHAGYVLLLDKLDEEDSEYGTRMARLLAAAQERGVKTSVDVVSEESDRFARLMPPALKYTDYCIINEVEVGRTTGVSVEKAGKVDLTALREAAMRILGMGVSTWVVVHWRGGAAGLSVSGEWVVRPSIDLPKAEIVTSTGAGDAFASGVLLGAWRGFSLAQSIELGIGTATSSLKEGNSTDGVGRWEDMLAYYQSSEYEEL